MIVTICLGSSCHVKGSREVVERLMELVNAHNLKDDVALEGSCCIGQRMKGVCVKVNGELYSISHDTVDAFFEEQILSHFATA